MAPINMQCIRINQILHVDDYLLGMYCDLSKFPALGIAISKSLPYPLIA